MPQRLAARLRLSNAEQAVLLLGAADHDKGELPEEAAAQRALYRLGPCKFEAHVLLASADEGIAPDDQRVAAGAPPCRSLAGAGVPVARARHHARSAKCKGPQIGDMLRRLEAEWIASDFTLDREALLAKVRQLVKN